jgi:hypothetical protein
MPYNPKSKFTNIETTRKGRSEREFTRNMTPNDSVKKMFKSSNGSFP